jgi:hypothetical protein
MGTQNFTSAINFRLLGPADRRDPAGRFRLSRGSGEPAVLLELIGAPFDAINTDVGSAEVQSALRPLLDVPRMSTMAIGAVLNRAVASMPAGQAFVNAGTWHGYTLLAAMAGNPDAICVGIDDFSEFGGPREESTARFEAARSNRHSFYDMDYRDYLADVHEGPIGVYLYDGADSYEAEFDALVAAEPFFADGCLVMADDTNRRPRRQAMLDFAEQSRDDYSLVLDVRTGANRHPTFWNGTLVLRKTAGGTREPPRVLGHESADRPPAADTTRGSSVTVVLLVAEADGAALGPAVEMIRALTWGDLELIVADCSPVSVSAGLRGSDIAVVEAPGDPAAALSAALERSGGDLVAFVDHAASLRADAVELSLAYPRRARFSHRPIEQAQLERLYRRLAAGEDVDALLPPGTPFLIVGDALELPQTLRAGPAIPLAGEAGHLHDVDEDAALTTIRGASRNGVRHLVVLGARFPWLAQRSGVEKHLTEHASELIGNDHVRVFAMEPA